MKVLLLTRYGRLGASSRLRYYQYLPYLSSVGIEVLPHPLFGDYYQQDLYALRGQRWGRVAAAYIARAARLCTAFRYDAIWIEYELLPWLPGIAERMLSLLGIPYVVDYDDAIFHRYGNHRHAFVRTFLGAKIDAVMRGARIVIAGNTYLGDYACKVGAHRVEVLPTVVDLSRYASTPSRPGGIFTIGWMGSPSTVRYLGLLSNVLRRFCAKRNARMIVVGAQTAPVGEIPIEFHPWSEDTEAAEIAAFDVGIMPLPDEPWERGKCGYKVIQYMAGARPAIASPVGANRTIIEPGVNGLLAATSDDWLRHLTSLYLSSDLRDRLGQAGRTTVEDLYCTSVTAPRLASILRSVHPPSALAAFDPTPWAVRRTP